MKRSGLKYCLENECKPFIKGINTHAARCNRNMVEDINMLAEINSSNTLSYITYLLCIASWIELGQSSKDENISAEQFLLKKYRIAYKND